MPFVSRRAFSCLSRSCFSFSCFPIKVDEEVRCFVDAHTMELRGFKFRLEALPDSDGEVFGRGDFPGELVYFFVEEAMVKSVEHFPAHNVLQLLEVDDETRFRINCAFYGHLQSVVMAVAVGVIAFAENALV